MKLKVTVLGAGFGGLELATILSEKLGEQLDLTIIDQSETFYFGFSKLDIMFNRKTSEEVLVPYSEFNKKGVQFRQELITHIDPLSKLVITDKGRYKSDILVVALGADYRLNYIPGLQEGGNEFYTFQGAEKIREALPKFEKGHILIGVTSTPFKCPPAPSEAALLLDHYLNERGIRDVSSISLVMPFDLPIPPSPDTSKVLLETFKERGINYIPHRLVREIDPARKIAILDDHSEIPFELFLGIPKHCVPKVVEESGLSEDGWIPVDKTNLKTLFPGVYAIGDVTSVGTAKAGVFAEGAGKIAAESIIAEYTNGKDPLAYPGAGSCYVEFGQGKVGRVDVEFFTGPKPRGRFIEASISLVGEKEEFRKSRLKKWFGK